MVKKYNLYFKFIGWTWRNVTLDKIKDIIFNQYSDLLMLFNANIYNGLRFDLMVDYDWSKLQYKQNNRVALSISEVKTK